MLSVLREVTVGHITYGRLHVAEYVFPDEAQESAGTLDLGKYNHFREAYVLDVDE